MTYIKNKNENWMILTVVVADGGDDMIGSVTILPGTTHFQRHNAVQLSIVRTRVVQIWIRQRQDLNHVEQET